MIFVTLFSFMNTHSFRMKTFVTKMNQIEDTIESSHIFGDFDMVDMICVIIFALYCLVSLNYTYKAFKFATDTYNKNKSNKTYNLYNLIFAETDFEITTDFSVMRYMSILICFVSMLLLALLLTPPKDEMLQFIDESGLINVYLLVLSFLISPVDEMDYIRYQGELEAMRL